MHSNHGKMFRNYLKIFKCVECSLEFKTRSDLNIHVIENHNDKDIECEIFGKPTDLLTQELY